MATIPDVAGKFYLRDFIILSPNAFGGRLIDPVTLHQIEIRAEEVKYQCVQCHHRQLAPVENHVEYACPRCDTRYMVEGEMLAVWNADQVGVKTVGRPPGPLVAERGTHEAIILDKAGDQIDPEEAKYYFDKSIKKFVKQTMNTPVDDHIDYALKTQVGSTGRSNGKATD